MKTFVIFDRKTGEILQTHVQTGDLHGSPEEIVKMARPAAQGEAVDIMAVEELAPGTSYRVDVKAKKLVAVDGGKTRGAGGASVRPVGGDPRMARHVLLPMGPKKKQ
jgi:hypothetical protein